MAQTETVAAMLRAANPGLDVQIKRIVTKGDTNHDTPLMQVSGEGIFVKELEQALLGKEADIAVHSLKDMPTQLPAGLGLIAMLERVNPADVLVTNGKKLTELPDGAKIGTGSVRRAAQLASYRPGLKPVSIRGNVDTRVGKVTSGELDGVILAAAGLTRLAWTEKITEYLPIEHFMPMVGQGIIAIEARAEDFGTRRFVAPLNNRAAWQCGTAERAFIRTLGGGCKAPIAALATISGVNLMLKGMVMDTAGNKVIRGSEAGSPDEADEIGTNLAKRLLTEGAAELLQAQVKNENW